MHLIYGQQVLHGLYYLVDFYWHSLKLYATLSRLNPAIRFCSGWMSDCQFLYHISRPWGRKHLHQAIKKNITVIEIISRSKQIKVSLIRVSFITALLLQLYVFVPGKKIYLGYYLLRFEINMLIIQIHRTSAHARNNLQIFFRSFCCVTYPVRHLRIYVPYRALYGSVGGLVLIWGMRHYKYRQGMAETVGV